MGGRKRSLHCPLSQAAENVTQSQTEKMSCRSFISLKQRLGRF